MQGCIEGQGEVGDGMVRKWGGATLCWAPRPDAQAMTSRCLLMCYQGAVA